MTERPGPVVRPLLLGYTAPRDGTRRPLSSTERTLWLLLAYVAGPVGTLALSGSVSPAGSTSPTTAQW